MAEKEVSKGESNSKSKGKGISKLTVFLEFLILFLVVFIVVNTGIIIKKTIEINKFGDVSILN